MHSTNYFNTFISVAEDCPVDKAEIPNSKKPTIPSLQFQIINNNPYRYTSDDVLFEVFAIRQSIPEEEKAEAREKFFSKSQACLRSSPLAKRYGWGIHHDKDGYIAIVAVESDDYKKFKSNPSLRHIKAMRSTRK